MAKRADGICVFRENRRCVIHASAGPSALPIGCRHYPRVVRLDRDDVSLSLSHYCPTAASLLVSEGPVRVVAAEPPLALDAPVEGLDARTALPPLLRPDILMNVDDYAEWERAAVREFSNCRRADVALRRIASATDLLREWRPGTLSLNTAVANAFAQADETERPWMAQGLPIVRTLNQGIVSLDPVPTCDERLAKSGPRRAISEERTAAPVERVIANYLAARVFGNWIAYQGRGLRTIVTWVAACHDVARLLMSREQRPGLAGAIEAIRRADYVMLHTVDTQEFANAARGVER